MEGVIFDRVRAFAESIEQGVQAFVERIVSETLRKILVILLAFSGVIFFLFGTAKMISSVYGVPGSGEIVIGIGLVFLSFLAVLLGRKA